MSIYAPSPIDDRPAPRCNKREKCLDAPMLSVSIGLGQLAITGASAVVLNMCCQTLCSARSMEATAEGTWACPRCVQS